MHTTHAIIVAIVAIHVNPDPVHYKLLHKIRIWPPEDTFLALTLSLARNVSNNRQNAGHTLFIYGAYRCRIAVLLAL